MWFKRKPKNRRLEREHLLDVKLRSQQLRAARLRFAGMVFGVLFGACFVVLVFWHGSGWLLNQLIYENDSFTIRKVEVQTDGIIDPTHLRRWALIKPNQNLLALDLARVKRDLELVTLIQSASVERVLPNTLKIRVTERVPIAQIQTMQLRAAGGYEQAVYQLDQSGFVFRPLDPRLRSKLPEPNEYIPLISGVDARELRPGRQVESEQIRAALQLILEFDYSPMFGLVDLLRIDISTPQILHAYTTQGSEIFFGLNGLDRQLCRWRLIHDQSQKWGKAISSLDLSISNNVPLRVVESNPNPAPRSRTRGQRTRTTDRRWQSNLSPKIPMPDDGTKTHENTMQRPTILPLLGERAGVRADSSHLVAADVRRQADIFPSNPPPHVVGYASPNRRPRLLCAFASLREESPALSIYLNNQHT